LAFVDVFMPAKDGVECIQELRQVSPDTVLVAITGGGAYGNVDILKVAERLGAARTLQKPFALGQLRDLLTELLPQS
jgi:DNA-binding NtrC family response regulator